MMLFIKRLKFIKLFQILSPILISISHENRIETSLASKKCRLAKIIKVDASGSSLLKNKPILGSL